MRHREFFAVCSEVSLPVAHSGSAGLRPLGRDRVFVCCSAIAGAAGVGRLTVVGITLGMVVRTFQRMQTHASQNCDEEDNESEVENLSTLLVE